MRVPVNSSHGQLVTAENCMTSWPAAETPCCNELTGASNAVLSLLWRVNRMLLSHEATSTDRNWPRDTVLWKIYNVWSMTYCLLTCRNYVSTYWTTCHRRLLDSFVQWPVTVNDLILYPCRSSLCGNYRARATLAPWTTEKLVWAAVADSHDHALFCSLHVQNTACALLFTLFSAQFLVYFLSDASDRGLRLRVIILLQQYCFDVCLFVCLWRVDCVTSRPGDELTCDELTVWRVDRVTSWLAAANEIFTE